jgi:hypothetical protein
VRQAVVRDLREAGAPAGPDERAAFETDVLAGFVLVRAAAGLADATIRSDVSHLDVWLYPHPARDERMADRDGSMQLVASAARCPWVNTRYTTWSTEVSRAARSPVPGMPKEISLPDLGLGPG